MRYAIMHECVKDCGSGGVFRYAVEPSDISATNRLLIFNFKEKWAAISDNPLIIWWAHLDSNQGPKDYESLTHSPT